LDDGLDMASGADSKYIYRGKDVSPNLEVKVNVMDDAGNVVDTYSNAAKTIVGENPVVNSKGKSYPEVVDLKTGESMKFPEGELHRVPKEDRAGWYINNHIKPKEFGGDGSFDNLTPVARGTHQSEVTPWWNAYDND